MFWSGMLSSYLDHHSGCEYAQPPPPLSAVAEKNHEVAIK